MILHYRAKILKQTKEVKATEKNKQNNNNNNVSSCILRDYNLFFLIVYIFVLLLF